MEKARESFLGALPIKLPEIQATNGATVNLTIIIAERRDEDSLRKWAEQIVKDRLCSIA